MRASPLGRFSCITVSNGLKVASQVGDVLKKQDWTGWASNDSLDHLRKIVLNELLKIINEFFSRGSC